jgi:predicted HD phosphohydrolase
MNTVGEIFTLLEKRGHGSYFGEPVSQLEHALQCAHLASQAGADKELVAAALLHGVGHLLHDEGEDVADRGGDTEHEHLGEAWSRRISARPSRIPLRCMSPQNATCAPPILNLLANSRRLPCEDSNCKAAS